MKVFSRLNIEIKSDTVKPYTTSTFKQKVLKDKEVLLDDGTLKYILVKLEPKNFIDGNKYKKFWNQLKEEELDDGYASIVINKNDKPSVENLSIFGNSDEYETRWLSNNPEDIISRDLRDRGINLLKRANDYLLKDVDSLSKEVIAYWLKKNDKNYSKNKYDFKNNEVNVIGNVLLWKMEAKEIPFQFGKIDGNFTFMYNYVKTAKGLPKEITKNFICANNDGLDDILNYLPKRIGGDFQFTDNYVDGITEKAIKQRCKVGGAIML